MTDISDMSQEEYTEYERKREEKRRKILAELDAEIAKDEQDLKVRIARTPNLDSAPEAERKEIEDIKKRISSNKEIRTIIGDNAQDAFRHGDFVDTLLDRSFDSHGGVAEGNRVITLPFRGVGLLGLLGIRELYYKLKDGDKK